MWVLYSGHSYTYGILHSFNFKILKLNHDQQDGLDETASSKVWFKPREFFLIFTLLETFLLLFIRGVPTPHKSKELSWKDK